MCLANFGADTALFVLEVHENINAGQLLLVSSPPKAFASQSFTSSALVLRGRQILVRKQAIHRFPDGSRVRTGRAFKCACRSGSTALLQETRDPATLKKGLATRAPARQRRVREWQ
jgi:hypothetical protein